MTVLRPRRIFNEQRYNIQSYVSGYSIPDPVASGPDIFDRRCRHFIYIDRELACSDAVFVCFAEYL